MCLRCLLALCVFAVGSKCVGEEAEVVQIPLSEIWALDMPGTKNVREQGKTPEIKVLLTEIHNAIALIRLEQEQANPAFVVAGTGQVALRKAAEVLVGKNTPAKEVDSQSELSVVFFTHSSNRYVRIKSAEECKGNWTIKYELVPHRTKELTAHLAIIPIGKAERGRHHVEVSHSESGDFPASGIPPIPEKHITRFVCGSFSFYSH